MPFGAGSTSAGRLPAGPRWPAPRERDELSEPARQARPRSHRPAARDARAQAPPRALACPQIDSAVVCLQRGLPERNGWKIRVKRLGRLMGDLYGIRSTNGRVAVLT